MMKTWKTGLVLVGMLNTGFAMADGNELLKACQSGIQYQESDGKQGNSFRAGYCMGGIHSTISLIGMINPSIKASNRVCLPDEGIKGIQAQKLVVKLLTQSPELLNEEDGVIVLIALHNAFPCK